MADREHIKQHTKPAEHWGQLTDEHKRAFTTIAHIIRSQVDVALRVYCYGSRVGGYWTDESDYDIVVGSCKSYHKEKLYRLSFPYKVDLKISASKNINYIEIP